MNFFDKEKSKDSFKLLCLFLIFLQISFWTLFTFDFSFDFSYDFLYIRSWQYGLAFFSGGALGVAGLLLQKMTKNTLSDVSILGIGSFNIICLIFYICAFYDGTIDSLISVKKYLPLVSIFSSIFITIFIYYISKNHTKNKEQFLIIGISLQFLFEALCLVVLNFVTQNFDPDIQHQVTTQITNYSYGKFPDIAQESKYSTWQIINIVSFSIIFFLLICIYRIRREIDLIEINEDLAKSYGINVARIEKFCFLCVAIFAGIQSALIGTISLLGIIAPSISNFIFGNKSRTNIITSFFIGGMLVLSATFFSINLGQNIPIGILSTAIIVPVFIVLIFKH